MSKNTLETKIRVKSSEWYIYFITPYLYHGPELTLFCPQALYLQNNKIKQLSDSIGNLKHLQTLNISGNNLKELPTTLAGLENLKILDVSNNSKLVKLPKELGNLRTLETLNLDTDVVTYPSKDITKEGTEAIMRFFCSGKQK